MLIAIGLTTVVIIGVPVLMYTMDTLSKVSQLEAAQSFADKLHNYTTRVDMGLQEDVVIEIVVPGYIDISASGNTLSIAYVKDGTQEAIWSESYLHAVLVIPPQETGIHMMSITLVADVIEIAFSRVLT